MDKRISLTLSLLALVLVLVVFLAPTLMPERNGTESVNLSRGIYPVGDAFPVMLYSVAEEYLPSVKAEGFNLVHTYGFTEAWLAAVGDENLSALVPLGTYDPGELWNESRAKSYIDALKGEESVLWWNLPEEMTWTSDWRFGQLKDLSEWVRRYDDQKRPTYEYLSGNYIASDISNYVPYVDIIGIGAYVDYNEQPRQWIRWAVKQVTEGIEAAGYAVGRDYLGTERVPVAVLQMFIEGGTHVQDGPESYHDVWSAICAGAKGVLIFSHHYRNLFPPEVYEAFAKAAGQLTGPHDLGSVALFGRRLPEIIFTVTSGPQWAPPFDSWGGEGIALRSMTIMAREHDGRTYIFAVNDVDEHLTVKFEGLRGRKRATVIDENRTLRVVEGGFVDSFDGWEVHLYMID